MWPRRLSVEEHPVWKGAEMFAAARYEYELRDGDEVVATGRITVDQPLAVGDQVTIGSRLGVVTDLLPPLGGRDLRIIVRA